MPTKIRIKVRCRAFAVASVCLLLFWIIPSHAQTRTASTAPATSDSRAAGSRVDELPVLVFRSDLSDRTDAAVGRAVRFLLARQKSTGSFEDGEAETMQVGGETALVTLALLSAGQPQQSPAIQKAVAFLKRSKPNGTYAVALRACVYASLPESMRTPNLRDDLRWLQQSMIAQGPGDGTYTYSPAKAGVGDLSNSQYGVLGVWYAQGAGLEVPLSYWRRVESAWRKSQSEDGGFGYTPGSHSSYGSMSAAGAVTLQLTQDFLHAADSQNLSVPVLNKPLEEAMKWLGKYFAVEVNPGLDTNLMGGPNDDGGGFGGFGGFRRGRRWRDGPEDERGRWLHYMLFAYERVGEASGLTRFGDNLWFEIGARFLIRAQQYDGRWLAAGSDSYDDNCATAYALLFLSRGSSPVVIQKLQYTSLGSAPRWNNRPRDVSNFTRFLRRATERHVNWQVVAVDAPPAELDEAPLLYLSGDRPPKFSDLQKQNLLNYVGRGGTLICVNEGTTPDFTRGIESLAKELWPDYKLRDLSQGHPVFSANFNVKPPAETVRGLSNGVRELVVLFPSGDMTWRWQSNGGAVSLKQSPYASLANLFLYATGNAALRGKGETTWLERNKSTTLARTVSVARLRYAGDWNPEPLAWDRIANILHNAGEMDISTTPVTLSDAAIDPHYALAHLCATEAFDLKASELDAIRTYIEGGGLLLADAAGGSVEAAQSMRLLCGNLYPNGAIETLPVDHAIYAGTVPGARPIERVSYRRSTDGRLPPTTLPRLKGLTVNGRLVAIVSDEDLSAAMVGYTIGGTIVGYSPASARDLIRNICAWRVSEVK